LGCSAGFSAVFFSAMSPPAVALLAAYGGQSDGSPVSHQVIAYAITLTMRWNRPALT
jgi:hypothetical protein